jgi:hypothetical protein
VNGRRLGITVAALLALSVAPALAIAASTPPLPVAGAWTSSFGPNPSPGSLKVAISRTEIRSLTFGVGAANGATNCPIGSVTVDGSVVLRLLKITGQKPFWASAKLAYKVVHHIREPVIQPEPVRATLDGKTLKSAAIELEVGGERRLAGSFYENAKAALNSKASCGFTIPEFRPSDDST